MNEHVSYIPFIEVGITIYRFSMQPKRHQVRAGLVIEGLRLVASFLHGLSGGSVEGLIFIFLLWFAPRDFKLPGSLVMSEDDCNVFGAFILSTIDVRNDDAQRSSFVLPRRFPCVSWWKIISFVWMNALPFLPLPVLCWVSDNVLPEVFGTHLWRFIPLVLIPYASLFIGVMLMINCIYFGTRDY